MVTTELVSNARILEKLHGTRSFELNKTMLPNHLVVDARKGDELWEHVKVAFMPIGPKRILGAEHPTASKKIRQLQEEWGTGQDSFPAMIFVPMGTKSYKGEWAMVRPDHLNKSPEELLASIARAKEDLGVQEVKPWIRSLEFTYAAVTGIRPPGSNLPTPLKVLPAGNTF